MDTQRSRILKLPSVLELTGLGRDTVYRLARTGRFPRPIKISERASGWLASEVEEYLTQRAAMRQQGTGEVVAKAA